MTRLATSVPFASLTASPELFAALVLVIRGSVTAATTSGPALCTGSPGPFDAFDLDFPSASVPVQNSCVPGEVPVYRLWNQRVDSNHRYTTDPAIKAQMIAKGYVAEGCGPDAIMMCAFTR
jgi:hypothetical protein